MAKRIITEADVLAAAQAGQRTLCAAPDQCIITDQARDRAALLGLVLTADADASGQPLAADQAPPAPEGQACPAAGSDARDATAAPDETELVRLVTGAVCAKLTSPSDRDRVEHLVRQALAARGQTPGPGGEALASGEVVAIESGALFARSLSQGLGDGSAVMAEVFGDTARPGLGAGCLCWEKASFLREVEAPEIDVVIEGELRLSHGPRTLSLKAGDMVYLRKGAKVVYDTPTSVKLACINGVN